MTLCLMLIAYLHYKASVHRGFSVFRREICSEHGGVVILRVIVKLSGKKQWKYCFIKVFQTLTINIF